MNERQNKIIEDLKKQDILLFDLILNSKSVSLSVMYKSPNDPDKVLPYNKVILKNDFEDKDFCLSLMKLSNKSFKWGYLNNCSFKDDKEFVMEAINYLPYELSYVKHWLNDKDMFLKILDKAVKDFEDIEENINNNQKNMLINKVMKKLLLNTNITGFEEVIPFSFLKYVSEELMVDYKVIVTALEILEPMKKLELKEYKYLNDFIEKSNDFVLRKNREISLLSNMVDVENKNVKKKL